MCYKYTWCAIQTFLIRMVCHGHIACQHLQLNIVTNGHVISARVHETCVILYLRVGIEGLQHRIQARNAGFRAVLAQDLGCQLAQVPVLVQRLAAPCDSAKFSTPSLAVPLYCRPLV